MANTDQDFHQSSDPNIQPERKNMVPTSGEAEQNASQDVTKTPAEKEIKTISSLQNTEKPAPPQLKDLLQTEDAAPSPQKTKPTVKDTGQQTARNTFSEGSEEVEKLTLEPKKAAPAPEKTSLREVSSNIPKVLNKNKTSGKLTSRLSGLKNFIKDFSPPLLSKLPFLKQTATGDAKKTSEKNETGKGNAFTRLFGGTEEKQSESEGVLIENIMSQSQQGEQLSGDQKRKQILQWETPKEAKKILDIQEENKKREEDRFQVAKICVGASLLVPLASFLLSAILLSTDGFFSEALPNKNYGLALLDKQAELKRLEGEIMTVQNEQESYEQKISEIRENKVLGSIGEERIHWQDVLSIIRDTANKAFPGNEISHHIQFLSYGGKSANEKHQINVQGTATDPGGRTWEMLIRLKDALNHHPNFDGVSITQFVKQPVTANTKISSSEYTSPFAFQFDYFKNGNPSEHAAAAE